MSAKKELYKCLRERILNNTKIRHCQLFNSQFDEMEQENTFLFPCVFIEFLELNYVTKSEGLQEADAVIRLHVGFESVATEELEIMDIIDDIHEDVQGFNVKDLFTPMDRRFEAQDTNHDNVIVWNMDYDTLLTDLSGHRNNKLVKTKLTEICVVADTSTEATKPRLKRRS